MEISLQLISAIIASLGALGTAGILIQNWFSSKKMDKLVNHYEAERKSPEWEFRRLETKGKGRTQPYIVPVVENTGEGIANNTKIKGDGTFSDRDGYIPSGRENSVEKVYPGNEISVKTPINEKAEGIRLVIRCDGEDKWEEKIELEDYEFEEWMEKKLGRH